MPLDPDHVCLMARSGCSATIIAERLGVTARHVRRLLRANGVTPDPDPRIGTSRERDVWAVYHALGESPAQVARRFGRSRQAVTTAVSSKHKHAA